jgi:hypothetical protein
MNPPFDVIPDTAMFQETEFWEVALKFALFTVAEEP